MGNILFHLQFPAPSLPAQIILDSLLESIDRWGVYTAGGGQVLDNIDNVTLTTNGFSGAEASVIRRFFYPRKPLTWSKNRSFHVKAEVDVESDANSEIYICTGDEALNHRAFGFRFINNKIRGFSQNGAAAQYVDLVTGLTPPYSRIELYEAFLTSGSKVDFYIDGVLKGTLTSGIPTGSTDAEILARMKVISADTVFHQILFSMFKSIQDE